MALESMEDLTKQLIARLDGYEGNSAGREDFIGVIADARRDAAITKGEDPRPRGICILSHICQRSDERRR